MRPFLVVILDPLLGNLSDLFKVREEVGIEDFVSIGSIKSLKKENERLKKIVADLQLDKVNRPGFCGGSYL